MKNRQKILPWMYSLPALVLVGIIVIFPILYTGYISLTNMNMYHWDDYHLIGLSNFKRALLKVDSGFLNALLTTIFQTELVHHGSVDPADPASVRHHDDIYDL